MWVLHVRFHFINRLSALNVKLDLHFKCIYDEVKIKFNYRNKDALSTGEFELYSKFDDIKNRFSLYFV